MIALWRLSFELGDIGGNADLCITGLAGVMSPGVDLRGLGSDTALVCPLPKLWLLFPPGEPLSGLTTTYRDLIARAGRNRALVREVRRVGVLGKSILLASIDGLPMAESFPSIDSLDSAVGSIDEWRMSSGVAH